MLPKLINSSSSLVRHSIATLVSLVLTGIVIYVDTRGEVALDNQKLQAIVDGVADSVDRQLASWRLSLSAMGASSDLVEPYDLNSFALEAKRFAELTGTNIAFFQTGNDGLTLLAHTQVPMESLPQYFPMDKINAFYATMKYVETTGKADVSNFFVGPIAGEFLSSIVISKTQQPNSNELLSLNFTSSYLSHILDQIQLPKDYIIGLVDQNGVIGARSEDYKNFVGRVIPKGTLDIYLANEKGTVRGDAVRGAAHDTYRISFRRLKEARGWTISLLVPTAIYPTVTIGPLSIAVGFISLLLSNGMAWVFGAAQRQKIQLEEGYRLSTRRLLDELPGAILRGRFDAKKNFQVILAFGKLARDVVVNGAFRFEQELQDRPDRLSDKISGHDGHVWDITDQGRVYRLFMNISSADAAQDIEYNVYVFDISDQRAAEIAAINSARLAALGQMAATLAHEMSQPLNVIALAADNAESLIVGKDPDRARTKVNKIKEFAIKSRKLIDNLLVYSRGDSEEALPIAVDLGRSIDLALDLTNMLLRSLSIKVHVETGSGRLDVFARPVELENIFVNLLMNSVDAFKHSKEKASGEIRIFAHPEGDEIVVRFSDNAGGIASHVQDRLFEPFITTKPVGHGTGLGLAFVSGNIRAWGGEIIARNIEEGAEFEIRFRRAESATH